MVIDMAWDLLAFTGFPTEHWSAIRSNNPQEQLNKGLRRRTDVAGISPIARFRQRLGGVRARTSASGSRTAHG